MRHAAWHVQPAPARRPSPAGQCSARGTRGRHATQAEPAVHRQWRHPGSGQLVRLRHTRTLQAAQAPNKVCTCAHCSMKRYHRRHAVVRHCHLPPPSICDQCASAGDLAAWLTGKKATVHCWVSILLSAECRACLTYLQQQCLSAGRGFGGVLLWQRAGRAIPKRCLVPSWQRLVGCGAHSGSCSTSTTQRISLKQPPSCKGGRRTMATTAGGN